jgi:protein-S-isoprenylcysteine O-methyltransferase Ste14/predicted DCC family thiol-disulfide oxidoreductase YuxK
MSLSLPIREARPASAGWNLLKMFVWLLLLWGLFFAALPAAFYVAEQALGLAGYRFAGPLWEATGLTLFLLGSVLHLAANLELTVRGAGTPLYFDCPRRLVIAGPYRYLRNPMALAALAQSAGVGLFLGSPLVLLYALLATLAEHFLVRPAEEADLERRFGAAYRRYRLRVRCWRPRLRGYDPGREDREPPVAAERTTPPGRFLVLYDGHCKFCTAGAKKLAGMGRPGVLHLVSFQEPGVLDPLPGVTHEACMRQMYLVTPDGRVYGGFEAAVQAVATRPLLGRLAYVYYLPGIRLLLDLAYAVIAANRYRIMGKAVAAGECEGGTCSLHFPHPVSYNEKTSSRGNAGGGGGTP